jgi:hypothetical protein
MVSTIAIISEIMIAIIHGGPMEEGHGRFESCAISSLRTAKQGNRKSAF